MVLIVSRFFFVTGFSGLGGIILGKNRNFESETRIDLVISIKPQNSIWKNFSREKKRNYRNKSELAETGCNKKLDADDM